MRGLTEQQWQEALVAYLKRHMREQGVDFRTLSQRLAEQGVSLDRVPLANKINRGSFGAGFLMQVLNALKAREDWLAEVSKDFSENGG